MLFYDGLTARGGSRQRAERRCPTALPRRVLWMVVYWERGALLSSRVVLA